MVSIPGDEYEREADRVSQVIVNRLHDGDVSNMPDLSSTVGSRDKQSDAGMHHQYPSKLGIMNEAERTLGIDIDGIRLDTSSTADKVSRRLNARAFTMDNHIRFAHGEYRPDSIHGQRLIAHELVHVAQQNRDGMRRSVTGTVRLLYAPTNYIQRTAVTFYTSGDNSRANPPCFGERFSRSEMYAEYARSLNGSIHAGSSAEAAEAILNACPEHSVDRISFIGHGSETGFMLSFGRTQFSAGDTGLIQAIDRALRTVSPPCSPPLPRIEFRACDVGQATALLDAIRTRFSQSQHRANLYAGSSGYNILVEVRSPDCEFDRWVVPSLAEYPLGRDPGRGCP